LGARYIGDRRSVMGIADGGVVGVYLHEGWRVVVGIGPAGMDERHLIDVPGQVRENIGYAFSALPVLPKAKRRTHDRSDLIAEEAGVLIEADKLLAVAALEFGFVIPGVDVARSAVDEEPDDALGLGGMIPSPRRKRPCRIGPG